MEIVNCPMQPDQPDAESEDELVRFDVDYLAKCLAKLRNTSFEIVERPDIKECNLPQPDYLVKDTAGKLAAIEHARFFESQQVRQSLAHRMRRFNILIAPINPPTPEHLGKRLTEFFDGKLAKEQFAEFVHCEKILLARNRWSDARLDTFMQAGNYFRPRRRQDCDHFYLILSRQILEVF